MLFYETEGEFGEDDFKITAKGLFLLDIGSASYTEYDPADPELIKYLMANPEALGMKKGHIHSHNNMGVFFSTTDDDELKDNAGFHNFYVSLIVNNKNEMCAKVAFKAKSSSENHVTLSYLNQAGVEKKKTFLKKKEDECIYTYKCDIFKPEGIEDSFKSRFQELKQEKEFRSKAKAVSEAATKDKALKGFNVDERWRQAGLFDDVKGSTVPAKGKEEKPSSDRVNVGIRTDPRIYSMLTKLLSLDYLYEGTLSAVLKKLDHEFYTDGINQYASYHVQTYYDSVETRAVEFYIDSFPEDCSKLLFFNSVMENCIEILETYENDYPELVSSLTEALSLEIK